MAELLDPERAEARLWTPLPGPQTAAYLSEADELFYGGAAGSGKTDLELGLGLTAHRRSIIFRREFPQLRGVLDRCEELIGGHGQLNRSVNLCKTDDSRRIEFGAVQYPEDVGKYQGRPHDLIGFDEISQFTESQYRFLIGWNRTTVKGQRCRVVAAGNPPTAPEGEWVKRYWAPWLDAHHPHPAAPGELRYFATIEGKDVERPNGEPFEHKGEMIQPRSRTFIPGRITDNPHLVATGYMSVLQGLPEPLRSQMLYGDFNVGVEDDPWQVIPTEWVRLAQARWQPDGMPMDATGKPLPQSGLGVDVARGGRDKTVLAPRYGTWFAPLDKYPGKATPDGPGVAALVLAALAAGGTANIDVIGVGASVYDSCRLIWQGRGSAPVAGINFAEAAPGMDRTGRLAFVNLRAHAYWSLREALDPQKGDGVALPPDPELLADLCAPKWSMRLRGIQVEEKEDIIKRLGRSPDCGDAVVLAAMPGPALPFGWMAAPTGRER